MARKVLLLLIIVSTLIFFSCSTSPAAKEEGQAGRTATEGESAAPAASGQESGAGKEAPVSAPEAADSAGGTDRFASPAAGMDAAGKDTAAPAADEEPELKLAIRPQNPETGEELTILTGGASFDSVSYDFGEGPGPDPAHVYSTFGLKTVAVTAVAGGLTVSELISFPVTANATLILSENSVEHDASWKPLIDAKLEPAGDFDTIAVYENGRQVLKTAAPEKLVVPVPFTGRRVFTAKLFAQGVEVADVGEVAITGLNSAPLKPAFEGPPVLPATPGKEMSFTVTAVDPNGDPVRYQVKYAPKGSAFDESTGTFTWTPARAQRGVYLLHITAYDVPYDLASPFTQRGIVVQ